MWPCQVTTSANDASGAQITRAPPSPVSCRALSARPVGSSTRSHEPTASRCRPSGDHDTSGKVFGSIATSRVVPVDAE